MTFVGVAIALVLPAEQSRSTVITNLTVLDGRGSAHRAKAPGGGRYRTNANAAIIPEMLTDWNTCTRITDGWTSDDYRR